VKTTIDVDREAAEQAAEALGTRSLKETEKNGASNRVDARDGMPSPIDPGRTRPGYDRAPSPLDLLAEAAEAVGAELWHCDRHLELIAEVTGQPVRRLGR